MKKSPRPLSIGERVAVYGFCRDIMPGVHPRPFSFLRGKSIKITEVLDNELEGQSDDGFKYEFHRRQCTPLKKVKKVRVYPEFCGYSKKVNEVETFACVIKARFTLDTHAMFSIELADLDKLTETQKRLYGVKG